MRMKRRPSRGKREHTAIFRAHFIAAIRPFGYVGIAAGDSPCANQCANQYGV
jgi:hypothetical protein